MGTTRVTVTLEDLGSLRRLPAIPLRRALPAPALAAALL